MFKRLRKTLQLKQRTFQPASSAAMAEARETNDIREKQKTQQQNESSSEGAASKEPKYEKHVSFSDNVQVKARTPSSPSSPSCNLESGFIFSKTTDKQSQPTSPSDILARYYAAAENTATSAENQCNPQSAMFSGKTLSQRMQMLYESSLVSQGIFSEPDSDDQVENSDQGCCDGDDNGLSGDMVVGGACGGYDSDTN
ncbi:Uncharacterised protein [Orientia tsutsugamushi]|uniref:hypothetical protein n=1 Tax=Orientia tsutsugamushi TaxID=784 RepID=UPI0005F92391|nr:hypothetical protein [Orientia tsutsugamushi]KJV74325.1 hypothetical protein OTSTA763_1155 [Orientia tsutsugamushi str. TA763]SPP24694.1 Uncharacterised protein [Orientia tsutsugamushi]